MARLKSNEEAWEILFEYYNILEHIKQDGYFIIKAEEINEYREARLMTKFDNSDALPKIFKNNNLAILPIANGEYMIANFCVYEKFDLNEPEIEKVPFPEYIQSLDSNAINSEAIAINCAYVTKMLEKFLNEEELVPTISGKMGAGEFEFEIQGKNEQKYSVEVKNARIEIDGGYEGVNSLAIIEAKNYVSSDFMVRQLYYPYRVWKNRVAKDVRPVYIVYSNGIFNFYEYKFEDERDYSSLKLINHKRYSIEETSIEVKDLEELLLHTEFLNEPEIPFPQANDFERVINLCELLAISEQTALEITENYAFDSRQTNYYTDAGRYLGLIDKARKESSGDVYFFLTDDGKNILKQKYKQRQLLFAIKILSHKIFNDILNKYFNDGIMPSDDFIVEKMKEANLYNITQDSTYKRRASTIKRWVEWIVKLID